MTSHLYLWVILGGSDCRLVASREVGEPCISIERMCIDGKPITKEYANRLIRTHKAHLYHEIEHKLGICHGTIYCKFSSEKRNVTI